MNFSPIDPGAAAHARRETTLSSIPNPSAEEHPAALPRPDVPAERCSALRPLIQSARARFSSRRVLALVAAGALGGAWLAALACGPFFPNRFLDAGDDVLLASPAASFRGELQRLKLLPSPRDYASDEIASDPPAPAEPPRHATIEAELADLRIALAREKKLTTAQRDEIIDRHRMQRRALAEESDHRWLHRDAEAPARRAINVDPGLPAEFAAYFDGAIAWKRGDTNSAIAAWERVLALPAAERRHKSVWAAYMLGKARLATDADRAAAHFREARALAKEGFRDPLGLASSSLGWEAKTCFEHGKNYEAALRYLEEAAVNGMVDSTSVLWVAGSALAQGNELDRFARHPQLVRVITAYLLERDAGHFGNEPSGSIEGWLAAVETARVRDVEAAEQLALAAYTFGDFDRARRWLKVAPATPVAQWVQAKLLLRDGKVNEAAALLARLVPLFPAEKKPDGEPPTRLADIVHSTDFDPWKARSAGAQLRGELATLRLARREFTASLDAFLQGSLWDDAAYVAERVLTLDELKQYVDARQPDPGKALHREGKSESERMAIRARWLLARRLVREGRGDEAGPYYPLAAGAETDYRALHAELIPALRIAWDEGQPKEARARAFITAGRLAKRHGMELLGTELAPDYFIREGGFTVGITPDSRNATRSDAARGTSETQTDPVPAPEPVPLRLNVSTPEERRRTAIEPADPPQRFHYRYIAADLLWRAAELLPDQSDEKARVLCEGGTMLKSTNPAAADRYYKALVRRCGQTAMGKLADEVRWFPYLDSEGNLLPDQPRKRKGVIVADVTEASPEN